MFFTSVKLYKWYQIVQNVTNMFWGHHNWNEQKLYVGNILLVTQFLINPHWDFLKGQIN